MKVSAADKGTGKSEQITITVRRTRVATRLTSQNDKGRLSQEEIDRMVADAEKCVRR